MEKEAYLKYSDEVQSWLHIGRAELIKKILKWHFNQTDKDNDILEIGAGVGQNLESLKNYGVVDALECDQLGLEKLKKVKGVREIIYSSVPCKLRRKYDIIGAFDVIEHIEEDKKAIQWIVNNLKAGGIFIVTVPAFQCLYSDHDRILGHYRRYSSKQLKKIVPKNIMLLSESYFNTFLFPIAVMSRIFWSIKNKIGRLKNIKKQPVPSKGKINDILKKIFLYEIQKMKCNTRYSFGLSYYACFKKVK